MVLDLILDTGHLILGFLGFFLGLGRHHLGVFEVSLQLVVALLQLLDLAVLLGLVGLLLFLEVVELDPAQKWSDVS